MADEHETGAPPAGGKQAAKPKRTKKTKLHDALSPKDMARVLQAAEAAPETGSASTKAAGGRKKNTSQEEATQALFNIPAFTRDKGKQKAARPFRMAYVMDKKTYTDNAEKWAEAVQNFGQELAAGEQPASGSGSTGAGTSLVAIAGVIPAGPTVKTRAVSAQWLPPSWDKRAVPPTQVDAMHIWRFRKEAARGFLAATNAFHALKQDELHLPVLDRDEQLLMIVQGEAGTGKSHLIEGLCWYFDQHSRANEVAISSFQGRPVIRLRNPAVPGYTTSALYQVNSREGNTARSQQASLEKLHKNVGGLSMVIEDEFSLDAADHFSMCSMQAARGLASRAVPDAPFGGLHKILVGDPFQQTPVEGDPLWFGQASSPAQAAITHMYGSGKTRKIPAVLAGVTIFRQFKTVSLPHLAGPARPPVTSLTRPHAAIVQVITLDEQMRQSADLAGADELHDLLTEIRNSNESIKPQVLEQLNRRAIGAQGQPKTLAELAHPMIIVQRHTLINIINKEMIPTRAKDANQRVIKFYPDIKGVDSTGGEYTLPEGLLRAARDRPREGHEYILPYYLIYQGQELCFVNGNRKMELGWVTNSACKLHSIIFDAREQPDPGTGDHWELEYPPHTLIVQPLEIDEKIQQTCICPDLPAGCVAVPTSMESGPLQIPVHLRGGGRDPLTQIYIRRRGFHVIPIEAVTPYFMQGNTTAPPQPVVPDLRIPTYGKTSLASLYVQLSRAKSIRQVSLLHPLWSTSAEKQEFLKKASRAYRIDADTRAVLQHLAILTAETKKKYPDELLHYTTAAEPWTCAHCRLDLRDPI